LLRFCRWRVLVWIATISDGFYLSHIPPLSITDRWLAPWPGIPPHGPVERVFAARDRDFAGLVFGGVLRVEDFKAE